MAFLIIQTYFTILKNLKYKVAFIVPLNQYSIN